MEGIFEKINDKVKSTIAGFFDNTSQKTPKFSIQDSAQALFFIYLQNNKITLLSHKDDQKSDEIVKVGLEDNQFNFYPIKQDSIFFGERFEIQTNRFCESILQNKLNLIAYKIYNDIEFFLDKVVEYEALYINKIKNMQIRLDLLDKTNIIVANDELHEKCKDKILEQLHNLATNNIKDSHLNIFTILHPNGISDIEQFMQQKTTLNANTLKNYYNKSNLSNPNLIEKINIEINNQILEINYLIKNLYLQTSKTGQIYATSKVIIDSIDGINIQPDEILYSNNEIKVTISKKNLTIKNLTNKNIFINNITSIFYIGNSTQPFTQTLHSNIKINANEIININKKNTILTNLTNENLHQHFIINSIKINYAIDDEIKNLIGSSKHKLSDIIRF